MGTFGYPDVIKDYRQGKELVHDAEVIQRYSDSTMCITIYKLKNGEFWYEFESRLEAPYDDYVLNKTNIVSEEK